MPRPKIVQPEPVVEEMDAPVGYQLEPLNEDIVSRINVWGNSTGILIQHLTPIAPEWAKMFTDLMETVKMVVAEQSE